MAANASISKTTQFGTTLAIPAGPMQVAALGDLNGNLLKTVDNSDGTSSLVVSGTITSGGVAQGSTTSGQTGSLTQGAVTTAAPTYTTGQTDPLSLTTAGALRVDGSGVTQPVSGTVTTTTPAANTASVNLTGSNQVIVASAKDYRGFTIRETAGSTAVVVLFDNASAASGTILEEITLAASESRSEFYAAGLDTSNGVFASIVSGAVAGSVRLGP